MGASDSSCTEKVGNMDVNNLQTGMSGLAASGMNVTCTRSSLYSKSKTERNHCHTIQRDFIADSACEKTVGAARVLSRARAKLAMLKKAQATGEYDSAELENAIAHAKRMVECADMKVNNLREEDRLRKRAEDKEELKVEKLRNAGRLENLKKRTHRQDENKALFDADTKYYQREGNGIVGAAASAISSAAASLELSSVSGQMRNLEITQTAITQSSVRGQSMDVIV